MIEYLVDVITSNRDKNGNCYHVATITRTSDSTAIRGLVDSPDNVTAYLYRAGVIFGQNRIYSTRSILPIRQFDRFTKGMKRIDALDVEKFVKEQES